MTASIRSVLVFSLVFALLAACGDPLADGDYRGQPLLSLQGPLLMPEGSGFIGNSLCYHEEEVCVQLAADECGLGLEEIADEAQCSALAFCRTEFDRCLAGDDLETLLTASDEILRLSLFWAPNEARVPFEDAEGLEQQSVSTASLPARYALTLYGPPPANALHVAERGQYAMAVIIAYYDSVADGRFDPSAEPLVGGTPEHAILYTPTGVEDPILGRWSAGYHVVQVGDCDPANIAGRYRTAETRLIPVELSGSAPFSRDLLPGAVCQDDTGWFEDVCDEAMSWQCANGHQDPAQCQFCGFPFLDPANPEAGEDPGDPGEPAGEPVDPDGSDPEGDPDGELPPTDEGLP